MDKRNAMVISIMAMLAALTGYMMSKISLVGRLGINMFHQEYKFLKVWWQGALAVFIIWLIIYITHTIIKRRVSKASALAANLISLIIAIGGLYYTYTDFRNDLTHNVIGERSHIGFYLFWIGWIGISLFFLAQKSSRQLIVSGKTA